MLDSRLVASLWRHRPLGSEDVEAFVKLVVCDDGVGDGCCFSVIRCSEGVDSDVSGFDAEVVSCHDELRGDGLLLIRIKNINEKKETHSVVVCTVI